MAFFLTISWTRRITSCRIPHHLLPRPYSSQSTSPEVPFIDFRRPCAIQRVPIPQPMAPFLCLTPRFDSQPKLLKGRSIDFDICWSFHCRDGSESDWRDDIVAIANSIQIIKRRIKWRNLVLRAERLYSEMSRSDFCDNSESAESLRREHKTCMQKIREVEGFEQELLKHIEDMRSTLEVNAELADKKINDTEEALLRMRRDMNEREVKALVSGDHDSCSCFIEVQAGPGGTVSMESAAMIMNMYKAWARRRGFEVMVVDERPGEITGIERATIKVDGDCVFGYAKAEDGVHRLEWIPSFDSEKRLHISLAAVFVMPILEDRRYQINESDLQIERFRAAGVQHTTDSVVRILHIPTNVSATCQNQRSQLQSKAMAMELLQSRLDQLVMTSQEQLNARECLTKINWANQIRTYCLHPNRMVKDLRSNYEVSDPDSVLEGDIDGFIYSVLSKSLDEDMDQSKCVLYYD